MANKDTSMAKKRLLSKQQEFENMKRDIVTILEELTENVTQATQTVLDKSASSSRRRFRASYEKADRTIEACLLKLMDARANLQHQSDDETGSDSNEDIDCRSSISSEFIKPDTSLVFSKVGHAFQQPLIYDQFEQNCDASSAQLKCESPSLTSFKQQPHSLLTNTKDISCNTTPLPPSQEPTKHSASPTEFLNDHECAVLTEKCELQSPQLRSIADKQELDCLEQDKSPIRIHNNQPPMFDVISEESEATITDYELQHEDALSFVGVGRGVKLNNSVLPNQVGKHSEGLAHQFKDLNLSELVNTLAHLTEPRDSNGNPEAEHFQKQVEYIYKHVAPNVSGAIDKFNQSNLMNIRNLSHGSGEPLAVPLGQFSPITKPNHSNDSLDLGTSVSNIQSSPVSNVGYNFEPFTKTTAVTPPTFSESSKSNTEQITPVKATFRSGNARSAFSAVTTQDDHIPEVSGMVVTNHSERESSPDLIYTQYNNSEVPLALPQIQFDDGSEIIATMEHINSPSSFYIRPKSNDVSLKALTDELSKCYDGSYLEILTEKVTVGSVCCALSYNDNNWYRAVIIQIHRPLSPGFSDGIVTVRYVDKGITEKLPLFRLRTLKEAFLAIPCQVVHCSLHNAKPLNHTGWTEEQIDTFSNLANRNDIKAKVHGKLITGELEIDLKTLEKSGSETVEVSILNCFINAACCCDGISSTCDDTPGTSPQNVIPDDNKRSKISFSVRDPVPESLRKKKAQKKKSARKYVTSRAANNTSGSDDDKPLPHTAVKPPISWEDLEGKSSSSSVEKFESVSNTEINNTNLLTSKFPTLRNIELNLTDYSYQDAMLSHVVSPSEFYVHPVVPEATHIDELKADLNSTYSKAQAPLAIVDKQSIPKGSFWCAKCPKDGLWYRAKVLDVQEIEDPSNKPSHEHKKRKKKLKTKFIPLESKFKVNVFYVDYGDSAWIESNDLRHLQRRFYKLPVMAVKCSLMSVHPKYDPNSKNDEHAPAWRPEAGKALESWAGEKTIRIQVFSAEQYHKTGELQVLLWGLENEECLFNEEIVKSGLADSNIYCKDKQENPQRCQQVENQSNDICESLSSWDPMAADFQDLRNSYAVDVDDPGVALTGYKARDEAEICMFYQRGQLCKRGSNCQYKHIQPPLDEQTTDKKAILSSNDSLQLPRINSMVVVEVTAIVNASHFYINFPYSSTPLSKLKAEALVEVSSPEFGSLAVLQTKLQSAYKDQFPREGDYLLRAMGEIVVAKFSLDNEWYRARVTHVDPERSRVKVFYVDYGNCEWVSEINIRDIRPEFIHLPFQAVESRLADIELLPSGFEQSKKDARAFFRQQVENRNLVAQIKDIIGDTLYMDLFYTENETHVNINWTLVSMGYAKRTG